MSQNDYTSYRFQNLLNRENNRDMKGDIKFSPSFLIQNSQHPENKSNMKKYKKEQSSLGFVRNFIHSLLKCAYLCSQNAVDCLLNNIIICQEPEDHEYAAVHPASGANSYFQSYQVNNSQSHLFSSDDEGEDEFPNDDRGHIQENLIDDYELPFVYFCDNIIYLLRLWSSNHPAFVHEVRNRASSWILSEPKLEASSFVNNQKNSIKSKRPKILNEVVNFLKRRELRKRMTRLHGDDHKQSILQWALVSRFIIFLIQLAMTNFASEWKHENDGFKFTPEEDYGKVFDSLVNSTFGGYVNWDANYFLHISVYGYTTENILAFFPLLPLMLFVPSSLAYFVFGHFISLSSIVIVFGVLLNTWLFVKCTERIYELTKLWSNGSQELMTASSLFFIFNPASIFFSGLYTETLFAYLTASAILSLFDRKFWSSMFYVGLSGLCRSNGILNIGFILAFSLQKLLVDRKGRFPIFVFSLSSTLQFLLCITPFVLFQMYAIYKFCDNELQDAIPSKIPLYCINPRWGLPTLPYSYVQSKYWNVGFLRYFQFKQIPNFILALPVLYVLLSESLNVFRRIVRKMKSQMTPRGLYFALQAVHGLFLAIFCFFFVHVQVSTRMIMAACPYLFLYMADSFLSEMEKFRRRVVSIPMRAELMLIWCAIYFICGTVGFSLGLPWT